jgi:hypothetical protein
MLFWTGFFSLLIGLISPAVGALFMIPTTGKILTEKPNHTNAYFIGWLMICVFLKSISFIDTIQTLNLVFGAGLSCFLLFHLIKKNVELNQIFMLLLLFNTIFIALRQFVFYETILYQYNLAADEAVILFSNRYAEGSERFLMLMDMIEMSKEFYMRYISGIWISGMMLCLMIGYYFLSRRNQELKSLIYFQSHIYLIYSLIIALALSIFSDYRVYSINFMIALLPLFFIQGSAVLIKKIGHWFINSKFLLIIVVVSILINPYFILIISVIGLFDNWFDFRNLSKSEDLNESHSN